MRKWTTILALLFSIYYIFGQNTVGTIEISNDVAHGYTLFTIHKKVYLINNCGQVINEWTSNYLPGSSVYLLPNGNLLRAGYLDDGENEILIGGHGGIIELFNWEGNIIWSFDYSDSNYRQHHDVHPLPNGNMLILAATIMTYQEAIDAGRDPNKLTENELYNEQIIELEPIGTSQGNVVWEWNVKDHLIQDIDETKDNYGIIAENPRKLDVNFLNDWDGGNNWLHINSIQYDETRDQIVISSRRLSEIWIIDHSTTTIEATGDTGGLYGFGGDFLYRWGNPLAYRQGTQANRQLFGQHMPYIIPEGLPNEGKIMIFNNGIGRTPVYSNILMIDPPITSPGNYIYNSGSLFGPVTSYFSYPDSAPLEDSEFFSAIVSNAQQLPNGNILVCEGREGHFFELNSLNDVVWDYIIPVNSNDGSISAQGNNPTQNLTFRAIKYSLDYEAFTNRNLTPLDPIELNSDLTPCNQLLGATSFEDRSFTIYPNPASDIIKIIQNTGEEINEINLFNISGQLVMGNLSSKEFSISSLPTGMYVIQVKSNNKIQFAKILKK